MERLYGLIGYPLGHSFSAKYFAEKFATEGITGCRYENFPIESIDLLPEMVRNHPNLQGFNVTIPYKQQVIPYLLRLSDEARAVGAVNCVRITPEGWIGHNTDVYGFTASLERFLQHRKPSGALILGTGGASKAVAYVLDRMAIPYRSVSRTASDRCLSYGDLTEEIMKAHPLIVNTTPLGTYPRVEESPDIPYHYLTSDHALFDLVYNPAVTEFLKRGQEHGAATQNGYDMLVGQAEKAWEIWNSIQK